MTQTNYTTKRRKFQHLTREKRAQIEILLRQKLPKAQIAREVGISRSTLYNELARGTVDQVDTELKSYRAYFWDAGQRVYEQNRRNSRPPLKILDCWDFLQHAQEQILKNKLSPDAICGGAKLSGEFEKIVCTDAVQLHRPMPAQGQKHRSAAEGKEESAYRPKKQAKQKALRHKHRRKIGGNQQPHGVRTLGD